jgi:hypothetical protein
MGHDLNPVHKKSEKIKGMKNAKGKTAKVKKLTKDQGDLSYVLAAILLVGGGFIAYKVYQSSKAGTLNLF